MSANCRCKTFDSGWRTQVLTRFHCQDWELWLVLFLPAGVSPIKGLTSYYPSQSNVDASDLLAPRQPTLDAKRHTLLKIRQLDSTPSFWSGQQANQSRSKISVTQLVTGRVKRLYWYTSTYNTRTIVLVARDAKGNALHWKNGVKPKDDVYYVY